MNAPDTSSTQNPPPKSPPRAPPRTPPPPSSSPPTKNSWHWKIANSESSTWRSPCSPRGPSAAPERRASRPGWGCSPRWTSPPWRRSVLGRCWCRCCWERRHVAFPAGRAWTTTCCCTCCCCCCVAFAIAVAIYIGAASNGEGALLRWDGVIYLDASISLERCWVEFRPEKSSGSVAKDEIPAMDRSSWCRMFRCGCGSWLSTCLDLADDGDSRRWRCPIDAVIVYGTLVVEVGWRFLETWNHWPRSMAVVYENEDIS